MRPFTVLTGIPLGPPDSNTLIPGAVLAVFAAWTAAAAGSFLDQTRQLPWRGPHRP